MVQNEDKNNKKTIIGKVEKVIFQDKRSGRAILSVIREDGKSCRVIGNIQEVTTGESLKVTGTWNKDEKYGWQFIAESIQVIQQDNDKEEPFDDGLMLALDFSNVLNKQSKEFRKVRLSVDYTDLEADYVATSKLIVKKENPNESHKKKEENTAVVDGVVYSKDMTVLISVPQDQTSFMVPSSVTDIVDGAFSHCQKLQTIWVSDNNIHFKAFDGVLYDYDVSCIICVPLGKTSVSIPNTITQIEDRQFAYCRQLKSVEIPESVKSIGTCAFENCTSLGSVTIPNSVTSIGMNAFEDCMNLTEVTISDSVTSIGEYAFHNCKHLELVRISSLAKWCNIDFRHVPGYEYDYSANPLVYAHRLEINGSIAKDIVIPDGIKAIKDLAFINSNCLERVSIPEGVTEIGMMAFYGCSNLVIDIPDTVQKVGEGALAGCKALIVEKTVDIDWKNVIFGKGYIRIPNRFGGCQDIKDPYIDSPMNTMHQYLAKMVPCLSVYFDKEGRASIVNAKELHDAVITLKIKYDLASLIRDGYKSVEILKRIDGLSQENIREFIPRDKSPYIRFLLENHAAGKYPIIPIVEYVGGIREDGALYTIMIDGLPNIVWENNNDARSTFVFRCTDENYMETRQLVFDYVMAEEVGKRKLLHTNECTTIFKEKPRMIVHNDLQSWAQRLMCNSKLEV